MFLSSSTSRRTLNNSNNVCIVKIKGIKSFISTGSYDYGLKIIFKSDILFVNKCTVVKYKYTAVNKICFI